MEKSPACITASGIRKFFVFGSQFRSSNNYTQNSSKQLSRENTVMLGIYSSRPGPIR